MTPDQHADLVLFWAMVTIVGIILAAYGVRAIARWQTRRAPDLMSPDGKNTPLSADMEAVYIPVRHTSMDAHTTAEARDITDDYEMPRVGRRLSDEEIIALLATQKGVDGARYRFSANAIAALMRGDRNTRLDQIRAVREGPPAPQVRQLQNRLEQLTAHEE